MNKLKKLLGDARSSFWLVPSLLVLLAIALAVVLIEASSANLDAALSRWPRLFGADADGARGMMSTIAGSMITVVGVAFSMILVVLAQASSQYSSRILRTFMRSRATQLVLGVFAGIFTYCLIVLRTIRGGDDDPFVPTLAVFFGFALALGGVYALVFFIHHIASSIQASSIIASVAAETIEAIDRLFPDPIGREPENEEDSTPPAPANGRAWRPVPSTENGYVEYVDAEGLLRLAAEKDTIVRMERAPGDFIVRDQALVSIALAGEADEETLEALRSRFTISRHRTVEQDADFGVRQIVDIALKALSPGVNDATTAVMCADYLSAILTRLASRRIPSRARYDEEDARLIAAGPTFESLLATSFDQIRGKAGADAAVTVAMLRSLRTIGGATTNKARRRALRGHVGRIAEMALRSFEAPCDRALIEASVAEAAEEFDGPPAGSKESTA